MAPPNKFTLCKEETLKLSNKKRKTLSRNSNDKAINRTLFIAWISWTVFILEIMLKAKINIVASITWVASLPASNPCFANPIGNHMKKEKNIHAYKKKADPFGIFKRPENKNNIKSEPISNWFKGNPKEITFILALPKAVLKIKRTEIRNPEINKIGLFWLEYSDIFN